MITGNLARPGARSQIKTVQDVIEEMVEIGESLGGPESTDGVACFNRLYLAVTRAVDDALGDGSSISPPLPPTRW